MVTEKVQLKCTVEPSMLLSNLLRSAAGTCRYCGNKAGILTRDHPDCHRAHPSGWNEMLQLAAGAARSH